MLHIITPIYRFDLIELVYQTIPNFQDIRWHIAISQRRALPNNIFLSKDSRVVVYYLDCEDSDIVSKRNEIFKNIKDGFFYLLDDDTKFLGEVYNIYKKFSKLDSKCMIIGKQYHSIFNVVARRPFSNPRFNNIDTGMVLAHHSVLQYVKWDWSLGLSRDHYFWSKCYLYFKEENTVLINNYISYHNFFNNNTPYIKVRKKIFTIEIKYDIYNKPLAILYILMGYIKCFPERVKSIINDPV